MENNVIMNHQIYYMSSQRSFQLKLLKITNSIFYVANEVGNITLLV